VEQTKILAAHHGLFGLLGGGTGVGLVHGDNGVDGRIGGGNAREVALQQLHGRQLLAADEAARFDSREIGGFRHGLYPVSLSPRSQ
jgi:hypothetical protein